MRTVTPLVIVLALTASPALRAQPPAIGGEITVNGNTADVHRRPSVAVGSDGRLLVVWHSSFSTGDASAQGVRGRFFQSTGSPSGAELQVNTYTESSQQSADVAAATNGDFLVVFNSSGSPENDSSGTSVQLRRFTSTGAPVGSQTQVNAYTTFSQGDASIAAAAGGGFVVAWSGFGPGADDSGIRLRRFNSSAGAIGIEFQVNTTDGGYDGAADVASAPDGRFVVVWEGYNDASGKGVAAQRFNSSGTPQGAEIAINGYQTFDQTEATVAMAPDGSFVAVWRSNGSDLSDSSGSSLRGRRFAATGSPLATEFQVNQYTTSNQQSPAITIASTGSFLVSWQSFGSPGDDTESGSIQGRLLDAAAAPIGDQFQINTYTGRNELETAVAAASGSGPAAVVWASALPIGSGSAIFGQLYEFSATIFSDGFESGDTSAWSTALP